MFTFDFEFKLGDKEWTCMEEGYDMHTCLCAVRSHIPTAAVLTHVVMKAK